MQIRNDIKFVHRILRVLHFLLRLEFPKCTLSSGASDNSMVKAKEVVLF
jgi:hypothetical protein